MVNVPFTAGNNEKSEGVGSNSSNGFKLGKQKNIARVIRVIDMLGPDADLYDPNRRDSLRAISFDEGGNLLVRRQVTGRATISHIPSIKKQWTHNPA